LKLEPDLDPEPEKVSEHGARITSVLNPTLQSGPAAVKHLFCYTMYVIGLY